MVLRWLIGILVTLTIQVYADLSSINDLNPLGKTNISEKVGYVCAFADFNQDRFTDVLQYNKGNLSVLLQKNRDFLSAEDAHWLTINVGLHDEIACAVGDINGDGYHDILVSTRSSPSKMWKSKYYYFTEDDAMKSDPSKSNGIVGRFTEDEGEWFTKDQPALIDVDGDGIHDMIGMNQTEKELLCLKGARINTFSEECSMSFPNWIGSLIELMPIIIGDVDNDLRAEMIFMKIHNRELRPEIWKRDGNKGEWKLFHDQLPDAASGKFKYTLAPLLFDLNLDKKMDFIVPVCRDESCTSLDSLQVTSYNGDKWREWSTVPIDMKTKSKNYKGESNPSLVQEPNTLARLRVGDYNLDGYPDLLVTLGSVGGQNNILAYFFNEDGNRFQQPDLLPLTPAMALGTVQMSYFFDFAEDGYLDILTQWRLNGDDWQWSIQISDKNERDVTFLKVQTFAPLPEHEDIAKGKGVIWGGACTSYSMEALGIDITKTTREAIDCQVPASSHKAGLTPSFTLFGLGRSPNFVDKVEFGVPRGNSRQEADWHHQHKQVVPNARMMVQPPMAGDTHWILRLYLTPSTLIFASLLVIASTCSILLIVVLILHFREKKVDRVERAAQSHRFHFDAM